MQVATRAKKSISFGSSGLLLTYHAGVALELLNAGQQFERVLGTSGGALIGALFCVAPDSLPRAVKYMTGRRWAEGLTWGDIWDPAERLVPEYFGRLDVLPENAHELASGRLRVFCTRCRDKKCVAFDHWASREDLLRTLQASCSFAWDGVEISGEKYSGMFL